MVQAIDVINEFKDLADRGQGVDADGVAGTQCADLAVHIMLKYFNIRLYGNAIDLLDSAKSQKVQVIYDAEGVNPIAGDLIVIEVPYHKYGHVALVTEDSDGVTIKTIEQNIDPNTDLDYKLHYGGPAMYNERSFEGVIGWIRPSYGGNTMGVKIIDGDLFSPVIDKVDPNIMNANNDRLGVDLIVIHHNAGTSDENARRTWYVGGSAGTSAHYQVADDIVWGCVGEESVAFHAGDYNINQRSIGIEHLNNTGAPLWTISEKTYKKSAELIHEICTRRGIPFDRDHILKHSDVYPTACPGGIDIDRLIRMARDWKTVVESNANTIETMIAKNGVDVLIRDVDFTKGTFKVIVKNTRGDFDIRIPVWTEKGGQDDLVWYTAERTGNDHSVTVKIADHKSEKDLYIAHAYAVDTTGGNHFLGANEVIMHQDQSAIISITAVKEHEKEIDILLSNIKSTNEIKAVKFPVWSNPNGQDDIVWYDGEAAGEGCYKVTVDTSKHANPEGPFTIHAYLVLETENVVGVAGGEYSFEIKSSDNKEKPQVVVYSTEDLTVKLNVLSKEDFAKLTSNK